MSDYTIQIVHKQKGVVAGWEPGSPAEHELIESVCAKARLRGIGVTRTEAQVCRAFREAWAELLTDVKLLV